MSLCSARSGGFIRMHSTGFPIGLIPNELSIGDTGQHFWCCPVFFGVKYMTRTLQYFFSPTYSRFESAVIVLVGFLLGTGEINTFVAVLIMLLCILATGYMADFLKRKDYSHG